MTPKGKAEELILKYLRVNNDTKEWFHKELARQCALVAVDEILTVLYDLDITSAVENYWEEVRQEIENL